MNRFKCTYWALGRMYIGDVLAADLKWATKLFTSSPNFERFEDHPYPVIT